MKTDESEIQHTIQRELQSNQISPNAFVESSNKIEQNSIFVESDSKSSVVILDNSNHQYYAQLREQQLRVREGALKLNM